MRHRHGCGVRSASARRRCEQAGHSTEGAGRSAGPAAAVRTSQGGADPFVLLVVLLLGSGLITLLVLNSALNEGSFKLSREQKQIGELTDEEQALQRDVDDRSAPGALAKRAGELGMVPGGGPAFLGRDGKVLGVAAEATQPPVPPKPKPSATPSAPTVPVPGSATATNTAPSGGVSSTALEAPSPPAPAGTTAEPTQTPGR